MSVDCERWFSKQMKLRLKRVELKNFRVHEHYVFTPEETGVTAIIGRNGHGKSTIINGIAWALYGTKPNTGIKNSSWRRIGAPADEPAWVDVVLDIDGHDVRVKRTLNGAKASTVNCECWVDGVLEAGPSVSHATQWIVNTLQMDEDGFLATVLVQQKHVGQLVSASPAARRKTLERLTGIEAVSTALDKAKEEERAQNVAVSSMRTVDETQIPKLENAIASNDKKADTLRVKIDKVQGRLDRVSDEGKALKGELDKITRELNDKHRLENELDKAEFTYQSSSERYEELLERKDTLASELPERKQDAEEMKAVEGELAEAEKKQASVQAEIALLQDRINKAPTEDAVKEAVDKIHGLEDLRGNIHVDDLERERESIRNRKAEADAEVAQVNKSLGELQGQDNEAVCPTCLRPIDDPEHLLDDLRERARNAKDSKNSLKPRFDEIAGMLAEAEGLDRKIREARDAHEQLLKACRDRDDANGKIVTVQADLKVVTELVKTLRKQVSDFEVNRSKYDEYDRVVREIAGVMRSMSDADARRDSIRKQLKSLTITDDAVERKRVELDAKREKREDLREQVASLTGDLRVNETERDANSRELSSLREAVQAHKDALASLEIASTTSSLIGKFREHMILSAIPRITEYASSLVEQISNGDFTEIDVDKKFAITVTCGDGTVKSVAQLSGGEEDLVAICLRLAISVMLSDGTPSMLILDEVLTAMDSERAEAILEAMQDLSQGQIIIVAHNEIVKSIADTTVEL